MGRHSLETGRLRLRSMHAGDIDSLLPLFSDPKVMASFGGVLFDRTQMEQWVRRNLEHQARYGYGLFTVILKESGMAAGDCGLEHMTIDGVPEVELGYDFKSALWNRGLATEAAAAVRDYAFGTLQLPRLISLIRPGNQASQRVAEKVGMHLSATLVQHEQEYAVFALSREEAARRQAALTS